MASALPRMDSCPSNQPAATPASIVGGQRVGLEDDLNGHRSGVASANHHSATSRKPRLTRPRDASPTTWGHRTNGTNRDFAGALGHRLARRRQPLGTGDDWPMPRGRRRYGSAGARQSQLAWLAPRHRAAVRFTARGQGNSKATQSAGRGVGGGRDVPATTQAAPQRSAQTVMATAGRSWPARGLAG
jgi:hypothetical protein